jgi:hypothetical protein
VLSSEQLRQQIRIRLARGRLPAADGVYRHRPGGGEACAVCRRAVNADGAAYGVGNPPRILVAHQACYALWREESLDAYPPRIPGRS